MRCVSQQSAEKKVEWFVYIHDARLTACTRFCRQVEEDWFWSSTSETRRVLSGKTFNILAALQTEEVKLTKR